MTLKLKIPNTAKATNHDKFQQIEFDLTLKKLAMTLGRNLYTYTTKIFLAFKNSNFENLSRLHCCNSIKYLGLLN